MAAEGRGSALGSLLEQEVQVLSDKRSPVGSQPKLRRREAGWEASGGERAVRNASEPDSAGCRGEPAAKWRSPDRGTLPSEAGHAEG